MKISVLPKPIGEDTKEGRMNKAKSFDELDQELRANYEYRKAERKLKPYYDLALEIVRLRAYLGLTQKDLAEKAGTYQSRISKIESSEFDIRLSTLINIAEALDSQVSIRLVPTLETYYANQEKLHHELFTTQAVTETGDTEVVLEEPKRYISVTAQVM
jgi:transcriptional regulator with XRE-family HTH domain